MLLHYSQFKFQSPHPHFSTSYNKCLAILCYSNLCNTTIHNNMCDSIVWKVKHALKNPHNISHTNLRFDNNWWPYFTHHISLWNLPFAGYHIDDSWLPCSSSWSSDYESSKTWVSSEPWQVNFSVDIQILSCGHFTIILCLICKILTKHVLLCACVYILIRDQVDQATVSQINYDD